MSNSPDATSFYLPRALAGPTCATTDGEGVGEDTAEEYITAANPWMKNYGSEN